MARKPGVSAERHQELGAELAAIHDRLLVLGVEIQNAYPRSSAAAREAAKMESALFRVRTALESEMCRAGQAPAFSGSPYFPHDRRDPHVSLTDGKRDPRRLPPGIERTLERFGQACRCDRERATCRGCGHAVREHALDDKRARVGDLDALDCPVHGCFGRCLACPCERFTVEAP